MKRVILALTLVLALLSFSACNKNTVPDSDGKPVVDVSSESDIRVGVILSGDAGTDNSYIQSHIQGIEAMRRALGMAEEQIKWVNNVSTEDKESIKSAVEACVADGCKVIFATEKEYAPAMKAAAKKNPEIIFCNALVTSGEEPANYSGYSADMYEAQYLGGIVAASRTKTGIIGYVGYVGEQSLKGINAFALGVERVDPSYKVYLQRVEERFDPEEEGAAAAELFGAGCDVVAQNTFSSAPQLAAAERELWSEGFMTDMTAAAPKAHLQAPVTNWGIYYTKVVKETIEGLWGGYSAKEVDGEIQVVHESNDVKGGLSDGLVALSPVNHNCARGTTAAVNEAVDEFFAGRPIFTGPLYDNAGNEVCPEGEVLTEKDIQSMDWYYRNILTQWAVGGVGPLPLKVPSDGGESSEGNI